MFKRLVIIAILVPINLGQARYIVPSAHQYSKSTPYTAHNDVPVNGFPNWKHPSTTYTSSNKASQWTATNPRKNIQNFPILPPNTYEPIWNPRKSSTNPKKLSPKPPKVNTIPSNWYPMVLPLIEVTSSTPAPTIRKCAGPKSKLIQSPCINQPIVKCCTQTNPNPQLYETTEQASRNSPSCQCKPQFNPKGLEGKPKEPKRCLIGELAPKFSPQSAKSQPKPETPLCPSSNLPKPQASTWKPEFNPEPVSSERPSTPKPKSTGKTPAKKQRRKNLRRKRKLRRKSKQRKPKRQAGKPTPNPTTMLPILYSKPISKPAPTVLPVPSKDCKSEAVLEKTNNH